MRKIFLISFIMIILSQISYAFVEGDYYSTSQDGMVVSMYSGDYELYINSKLIETGKYTINGNTINFTPNWNVQGSLNPTTANITEDCTFNWGQAGIFKNSDCNSNTQTDNNYAVLDSYFNLYIPELNLGNTSYEVKMQLTTFGQNYAFVVTEANITTSSISNPATFSQNGVLHIPVVYYGGRFYDVYLLLYSVKPQIIFTIYNVLPLY